MSNKMIQVDQIQAATNLFLQFNNVLAVWLFGSAQHGNVRPGGDIDIAIWFQAKPDLAELSALRAALQDLFQFDEVDLVVLNGASPITRFEAVSGQLLFCRDRNQTAGFVSLTAREFEDAMALVHRGLTYSTV